MSEANRELPDLQYAVMNKKSILAVQHPASSVQLVNKSADSQICQRFGVFLIIFASLYGK